MVNHVVDVDGVFQVNQLLREGIRQASEASHPHSHREVLALNVASADGIWIGLANDAPVDMYLAPLLTVSPPRPPFGGNVVDVMLWSLKLRFWAWQNNNFKRPKPDVRLFVNFFDPARVQQLPHSTGLQNGHLGIVIAFASAAQEGENNVVITHELMHTLGATDKYDLSSNLPRYPDGYANPHADPLLPQSKAEIMGGRIPLSQTQAEIPASLAKCVVGVATARQINWLK